MKTTPTTIMEHVFITCLFFRSFLREECPTTRAHRNFNEAQFLRTCVYPNVRALHEINTTGRRMLTAQRETPLPSGDEIHFETNEFSCQTRLSSAAVRTAYGLMEGVNFC